MRPLVKHLLLPLALFLLVVPMQLQLGSLRFNTSLAIMLLLAAAYFVDQIAGRRPLGREHRLLALLGLLTIWFLGISLSGEVRDVAVVQMCIYGVIMYASSLVLVRAYGRLHGEDATGMVLKTLFVLGAIHSVIQCLVLVSPAVSGVVYGIVALTQESATHISQGYRSPGLFSSGAAILGTFNAWILTIGFVAFLRLPSRVTLVRCLVMSLLTILEIAAIAVSGRTGFVALLICLSTIGVYEAFTDAGSRLGRNVLLVLAGCAVLLAGAALTLSTDNIESQLRWSFEFLYSLSEGEGLATGSTALLFHQMFFLPDGWMHLLFGTSNFGRSPEFPYVESDVGYVLMLYGGGVVGTLLMLSVFVFMLGEATRARRHEVAVLLFAFLATLFVVNVKDFYFIQNSGVTQLLMLCFALLTAGASPRRAPAPGPREPGHAEPSSRHTPSISAS
jgi:hypothetical protein